MRVKAATTDNASLFVNTLSSPLSQIIEMMC
jgi:hypothetical protein